MRKNLPELKQVPIITWRQLGMEDPDEEALKAAMSKAKPTKPGTKIVSPAKKLGLALRLAGELKQAGRGREFTPNYVLGAFWRNDWRAVYGTAARYVKKAADFIKLWDLRNDDPIRLRRKSPQGPAVKLTTVNQVGNEESVQWLTASDALHLAGRLFHATDSGGSGEVRLSVRVKHPIRG